MMTSTEMNNLIKQINEAFEDLKSRLASMEQRIEALEKPVAPKPRRKPAEEKA